MKKTTLFLGLMTTLTTLGQSVGIQYQSDPATGAITAISTTDAPGMNWIMTPDGLQYPWVDGKYGWGLGHFTIDGTEYTWTEPCGIKNGKHGMKATYHSGPLEIIVYRRSDRDGNLEETYTVKNISGKAITVSGLAVNTPFNDNYPDAQTCREGRCNTHVWTAGTDSYVFNTRMGGQPGGLALMLTEGTLNGYELQERNQKKGMSNFRGVLQLNAGDIVLKPGKSRRLQWKLFPARDWDDFTAKAVSDDLSIASAERYTVEIGDTLRLEFRNRSNVKGTISRNGKPIARVSGKVISFSDAPASPGEYTYTLTKHDGSQSRIDCLVTDDTDSLFSRRCQFIARHQQFFRGKDPRNGAYIVYDNETGQQYVNGETGRRRSDCDEGRERIGMGILMAQQYMRSGDREIKESLDKFVDFVHNIQKEDYTTNSTPDFSGKHRGYNYAWVADFWFTMYMATGDTSYLRDAYGTMRALTRHFGHSFYCIDLPVFGIDLLRQAGMTHEADTLLSDFKAIADVFATNGTSYPESEVNYEQSIVAPAIIHLLNMYGATNDIKYLRAAEEQMPLLESFGGRQPSFHLNDISIRHWDGFWFGKHQTWGDTFPHYWSTLTGIAFKLYAEATGRDEYAARAENIMRNNLCLFTSDGRGSAAYLYPDKVNGEKARGYDPFANDQDWTLVFYDRYIRDSRWRQFVSPPDGARTKVWWFHGETETTREGIEADLKAFRDKGVGGVVFYDQVHGRGEGAAPSMSPEWWEMLKYSAAKAKECGLSFEVAVGNGYVTGGPWITPELAMKKTAYVESVVCASRDTTMILNLSHPSDHLRDVALLMFEDRPELNPIQVTDRTLIISSQDTLIDSGIDKRTTIRGISYDVSPRGKGSTASMNIPGAPSDRYFGAKYMAYPPLGQLECSDDGHHWRTVTDLMPVENAIGHKSGRRSISFPATEARHFRIHIHDWNGSDTTYRSLKLSDIVLHTRDIVDNVQVRTGLRTEITYPHPTGGDTGAIDPSAIRILDHRPDASGNISVHIPKGDWRIIRFGYVPTGAHTKHGRRNLLGPEADVMSAEAARTHYEHYFRPILDTLSKAGTPPAGMCMDSHEAGIQNWTKGFETIFQDRNGYDLTTWLPAMAGYIVGSREATERVLSDFRKTVTATISSEYYGTLAELCRQDSVDYTSQAMLNILTDNIAFRGHATKPQGEFWAYQKDGNYDCLDAASAAHLFGKNIASGEAFTDTPYEATWDELLRIANIAYCRGINEFVVCASSYQPWADRKYDDSQSLHPYVFHRFHPEWESSPAFWDYQARCSALLRQGKPVVDLLVYAGEEAPVKTFAYRLPVIPEGYNFDVCSLAILAERIHASDGTLCADGGMTYKAIVVPEKTFISPEAERLLGLLASQGATVIRCDKGESLDETLRRSGIAPDISFRSNNRPDDKLMFFHRNLDDADIYFIYNHSAHTFRQEIALRTGHSKVEIWDPRTCSRRKTASTGVDGNVATDLTLAPYQSCFLIATP